MTEARALISRCCFCLGLILVGVSVKADIVYPARMQITETAPGIYQVVFILPVINGKILKAEPVFPEFCKTISDPLIQIDPYQKKTTWRIQCEGGSLQGQRVGIDGLLGSPIDIILEISTLEGRNYQTTLSPNETYYIIPSPPGLQQYLQTGLLRGSRSLLLHWGLALMILGIMVQKPRLRFRHLLLMLTFGVSIGYFMSMMELLIMPSWAGITITILLAFLFFLQFGLRLKHNNSINRILIIIGSIIAGGGTLITTPTSGYTHVEILLLLAFTIMGISIGVIILLLLIRQLLIVFDLKLNQYHVPLARFMAGITLGILLWKISLFWFYPSMLPAIPWVLLGFTVSLAVWWANRSAQSEGLQQALLVTAVLGGYITGIWIMVIPFSWAILLSVSVIFMIAVLLQQKFSDLINCILLTIGGLAAGNHLFSYADEKLSYPHARSLYFFFLLVLISLILLTMYSRWVSFTKHKRFVAISAWFTLIALILLGGNILWTELPPMVDFSLTEGKLPIPLLSLLLLLTAFIQWPKKSRIHSKMGLERKVPMVSLSLIAAALFFLPFGVDVKNPWYSMDQMNQRVIKDLMERRLWNTYTAFNIADEEELFDQLAQNLDEDLLDNIYLDSRRRLTMGLREGSEVTVKEVRLASLGEAESVEVNTEAWKFPASWTVTAQVKHLKHIHYRKNQYTGTIALKPMDEGWKISEIILTSEDRQVIAAGNM